LRDAGDGLSPLEHGESNMTNTSLTHLYGEYRACIATIHLDPKRVQSMLPEGLVLGKPATATSERYPVFFGFGRHKNVNLRGLEWMPMFPMEYSETFVGVPGLDLETVSGSSRPYHFIPRLLLNRFLPTFGGNLFWGLTKRLACISHVDRPPRLECTVKSLLKRAPLCSLTAEGVGEFKPASEVGELDPVRRLLDELVVTDLFFQLGPPAISHFKWAWETARIRLLENVTVKVDAPFCKGLRQGRHEASKELPAMEVRVRWSLYLPQKPHLGRGQRKATRGRAHLTQAFR
jgi:hypothetical protein